LNRGRDTDWEYKIGGLKVERTRGGPYNVKEAKKEALLGKKRRNQGENAEAFQKGQKRTGKTQKKKKKKNGKRGPRGGSVFLLQRGILPLPGRDARLRQTNLFGNEKQKGIKKHGRGGKSSTGVLTGVTP